MKLLCTVLSVVALVTVCEGAAPSTCKHGEYIPDKDDCQIYYHCVWSTPVKMSCPAGLVFSKAVGVCVGKGTNNADCPVPVPDPDPIGPQCAVNADINNKLAEIKELLLEVHGCACSGSPLVCPDGWSQLNDTCYIYQPGEKVSWDVAMSRCNALGGVLAEPDTESKDDLLIGLLASFTGSNDWGPWIGGKRDDQQSPFKWVTSGTEIQQGYENWRPGEPNNYQNNDERCVHYIRFNELKWNDWVCNNEATFFCQRSAEPVGI